MALRSLTHIRVLGRVTAQQAPPLVVASSALAAMRNHSVRLLFLATNCRDVRQLHTLSELVEKGEEDDTADGAEGSSSRPAGGGGSSSSSSSGSEGSHATGGSSRRVVMRYVPSTPRFQEPPLLAAVEQLIAARAASFLYTGSSFYSHTIAEQRRRRDWGPSVNMHGREQRAPSRAEMQQSREHAQKLGLPSMRGEPILEQLIERAGCGSAGRSAADE